METHIWLWKYAFLVTQGYGHDESVPYAWRNVRNQFRGCSPRYRKPSAALSQIVRHVFRVCSLRIRWLNMMYL
ncbi:MAG: hypothetical protein HXN79_11280 [Prevotella pallens]|uniref:hypothetical protein n=1 Tax=Prevotella pallens TaxID=60133 RepID=UPI001CAC03E9|nr:hypothetical protein [Prevotella pallens]MBF1488866.1 hypothetical protein [Prevotella pallens]